MTLGISTSSSRFAIVLGEDGHILFNSEDQDVSADLKNIDHLLNLGLESIDIAKDPTRPFIIYTDYSKTQVLGTSFDIKTFKDSEKTEIVVSSGEVAFSQIDDHQNLARLSVNDRGVLLPDHRIEVSEVNARKLIAW
ncbi:MAG: FecR domain-containing protein, partial [Bacteroidota bacterium]